MSIRHIEINGLRNLCDVKLEDCGRINILSGPNGSGKTSILEAIYILGLGRSFRSSRLTPIINHEMNACTIYGELTENAESYQSLGIKRSRQGKQDLRINKVFTESIAELARALPLLLINTDTFALVDGGPKVRRQFMDWGVFHVKPVFLDHWRNAQRCLRQRNHLLRGYKIQRRDRIYPSEIAAWDRELTLYSTSIDEFRAQYIEAIRPIFNEILQRLVSLPNLSLSYERGWKADTELQMVFEENFERDACLGTTTAGSHRANIDIRIGDLPAVDVLSRGQLKLVVSSLRLAQGRLLTKQQGRRCIYLIDDLSAELDKQHRAALCSLLNEMKSQVFITSVDADVIGDYWQDKHAVREFHVKQGRIENREIFGN